jgi:NADPH:quinone reductase-like Zn-dependent oxidoreductase
MKAIVYTQYGSPDVLHVAEQPTPAPKENEILVRVRATTVNFGDLIARRFNQLTPGQFFMPAPLWLGARLSFGWNRPRNPILGSEFAGVVAAVGQAVRRFNVGDEVFGYRGPAMGAYAEYVCLPEDSLVAHKPERVSFDQAAVVPYGAITAHSLLGHVHLQPGQKILINGASGSIGAAAVQIARLQGAEVTGVCSTARIAYVTTLGAQHVIDYTRDDFTKNGQQYDVILDVLGKVPFERGRASLTPQGVCLYASFKMKQLFQMWRTSRSSGQKVICALSSEKPETMQLVQQWLETGQFQGIVDRCFPMEQAAEAHRYAESGNRAGPVVIIC